MKIRYLFIAMLMLVNANILSKIDWSLYKKIFDLHVECPMFNNIFDILTPLHIDNYSKIRLGKINDGGYIVPWELLDKVTRCYTYGAGDDISFETDLAKVKEDIVIRIYDHTVTYPEEIQPGVFFKKEGIAPKKTNSKNTLLNHVKKNNDRAEKIILKIDVEGAEWAALDQISKKFLKKNVVILIVEFHWFLDLRKSEEYYNILKKLDEIFKIFHFHANNCGGFFRVNDRLFPNVLELTYINKNFIKSFHPISTPLPLEIDITNCPTTEDAKLDFWL